MIIINIDVMLAKRKISSLELAQRMGITPANLSILKKGKAKAIRFATLEAICRELECQPGDILEFQDRVGAHEGLKDLYRAMLGKDPPESDAKLAPQERLAKMISDSVALTEGEDPEDDEAA